MKREIKFFAAAALLCFCASALTFAKKNDNKPKYKSTGEEMKIGSGEGVLEEKHFAPAELAQWNVLIIDSNNTQRTIDYLNTTTAALDVYVKKGGGAGKVASMQIADIDWNQMRKMQDLRLKKIFKNVKSEYKDGEKYDLVIIRDCSVDWGKKSGDPTSVDLIYWFVYEITPDMLVTGDLQYAYRGAVKTRKVVPMPYPAFSFGLQDANLKCIEELNYLLEGGLDLMSKK